MKILILCPGKIANSLTEIGCFSDVLSYYLPKNLALLTESTVVPIPDVDNDRLKEIFSTVAVDEYAAILTLGLRFYSKISPDTTALLRDRFTGVFCQVHDGSRFDHDPVDITFTFKDDTDRLAGNSSWLARHQQYNKYMGWASDPQVNTPQQDPRNLRILVDHTNYGENKIDKTQEILVKIHAFIKSDLWKPHFDSVSVRRFDSGQVVDVDFNKLDIKKYDRTPIPYNEITKEHGAAHIFCVTHPESVGLVVLETAMAGALPVVPKGFIPADRLATVRHIEWGQNIPWKKVLMTMNPQKSRKTALVNTWSQVALRIYNELLIRTGTGVDRDND